MNTFPPVAVTGATGFLGRALCADLAAHQRPVRAIHRQPQAWPAGVESLLRPDLAEPGLASAFAGCDAVVHLAARVHVMDEEGSDVLARYRQVNVDGTRNVMLAARAAGVRRVIVASSVKAVGECNESPWDEQTVPKPVDPYGVSKLESERLALGLAAEGGPAVTVLRFPLIYGPGVRANALRLLQLVDRGMPLPFGRIRNRRSFLYVGNAVAAIRAVLASPRTEGETLFVSDGVDLSTPELVRLLALSLNRPARLVPVPESVFRLGARLGDLANRVIRFPLNSAAIQRLLSSLRIDSTRLQRLAGFQPPFTPAEGWRATSAWYREQSS